MEAFIWFTGILAAIWFIAAGIERRQHERAKRAYRQQQVAQEQQLEVEAQEQATETEPVNPGRKVNEVAKPDTEIDVHHMF